MFPVETKPVYATSLTISTWNFPFRLLLYEERATFGFFKLLADLGGSLGLFLGYSAYHMADLVDFLWAKREEKRENEKEEEEERKATDDKDVNEEEILLGEDIEKEKDETVV